MEKTFLKIIVGMLLLTIGLTGISCSKEKTAEKTAPPPEDAKTIAENKRSGEEAKKIVVAKVNGAELTMKELIDMMNQIAPRYLKDPAKRSPEIDSKVRKEALDTLVFRELAFQEAIRQGMKVKPEDVDATIRKLKTKFDSENTYKEYLVKSGLTEASLRKQVERDQLIEMINTKEVLLKTKVDEKLVQDTYNKKKASFVVPESFLVEDVFIQTVREDDAAAMNKAKETLTLIKKNDNNISKLAQDKTLLIRNGGITQQEYPNIFKAASLMKPGDLSSVIIESDGLHIIKLVRKEPSRQLSFEEARVDIEHKLMLPIMNKRKEQWANELKKNAKIDIIENKTVKPAQATKG